ncbi:MAG: DUF3987 domain-containing protein [Candidatus Brocadia sp.]|nr:DUF3987 domain-containing protein [Candidatus Brocadia sp.]
MNKQQILTNLDIANYFQTQIPSLKVNGSPNAMGLCPFHDDHNPSFSVNIETGLFNCFACGKKGDIFTFYQELKGVDFSTALRDLGEMAGMIDTHIKLRVVATFEYKDTDGKTLYVKERIEPGRNGRPKEFIFKHQEGDQWALGRGCNPVLYNLSLVAESKQCIVVEGEAKADLLVSWGFVATCLDSGANSPWKDEYTKALEDKDEVVIISDNDGPGKQYATKIANALFGKVKSIKIVELPGLQESEDIINWTKMPGNDKTKLLEIVKNTPAWTPTEADQVEVMEEVEVVPKEIIPVYDFPIEIIPPELKKFIIKVALAIDIGTEVVASIAMSILSSCIGNSIRVSPKQGYDVPPFMWTGVVLPPGSGKTPLIDTLSKPIRKIQSDAYQKYKQQMKEYKAALRNFKKDENIGEEPEEPVLEQYYTSDTTVEALADVFEHKPRGILNLQDELSSLILGMNQYKGGGNDRQHYLELFNCNSWKINRKSGSRFIPNTGTAIVGGIQPEVVPLVFGDNSFRDGFIHRFIFVCPDVRPMKFNRNCIRQDDSNYWENLIHWCYNIPLVVGEDGFVKSEIIRLNEEALGIWELFYNECGQLLTVMPVKIQGFIPKLILYSLKFMGILHVIKKFHNNAVPDVIDHKITENSIILTKYFFGQVGKLLKLYEKKDARKEYYTRIIHAIHSLQGKTTNGKLELQAILDTYNYRLPKELHLTSAGLSSILRNELGLNTKISTGGYSFLIWEELKLKKLFKATSTTSTSSTIEEKHRDGEPSELENLFEITPTTSTSSTIEEKHRVEEVEEVEVSPEKSKESDGVLSNNRFSSPHIFKVDNLEVVDDSDSMCRN